MASPVKQADRAVVLTTLLYGCEAWTLYRCHIRKLDQFHMRCLRKIAHIKWQEHIPNTAVTERCDITSTEAFLQTSQIRWIGHVIRMDDSRIPKRTFYGQLENGSHHHGGQLKRSSRPLSHLLTRTLPRRSFGSLTSYPPILNTDRHLCGQVS